MYSHEEEDSEARYVVLVQRGTLEDEFGRKLSALDPDALPSYAGPAEEQPWEASRDEVARWRGEHAARTVRRIGKTFAYLACPPLGLTLDLLESAGADAPLDEVTGELMRDERPVAERVAQTFAETALSAGPVAEIAGLAGKLAGPTLRPLAETAVTIAGAEAVERLLAPLPSDDAGRVLRRKPNGQLPEQVRPAAVKDELEW